MAIRPGAERPCDSSHSAAAMKSSNEFWRLSRLPAKCHCFPEFGAAPQCGNGKKKALLHQEGGKGSESRRYTATESTVAGQKGGQGAGVNEILSCAARRRGISVPSLDG